MIETVSRQEKSPQDFAGENSQGGHHVPAWRNVHGNPEARHFLAALSLLNMPRATAPGSGVAQATSFAINPAHQRK